MRAPRGFVWLILIALAGCGRAGSEAKAPRAAAAPARRIDPCALLTAADAKAALGGEVGQLMMTSVLDDARNSSGDPAQCGYGLEDDPSRTVRLEVRPMADAARAQGALDSSRSVLAAAGVADVPGLGDAAFWAGGAIHQLHLRKGSTGIVVTCDPGAGKDALAVAKAVAQRALGRLPG